MITGMGAREQPLILFISTAGANTAGPCYALQLEAQRMLDGTIADEELPALIYGLDPEDDWTDPELLPKANPNHGVSVLLARHRDAMSSAHDGCPVLQWMIGNVVALEDAKGNVYPRRERPENKIDGVVALIMALARALAAQPEPLALDNAAIAAFFGS